MLADLPRAPDYLWHFSLHEDVANEHLVYLFGSFEPTYDRAGTVEALKSALRDFSVVSYAFWELIGEYDLLIQAWVPRNVRITTLVKDLEASVKHPVSDAELYPIVVDDILSHWMWQPIDVQQALRDIEDDHFIALNGPGRVSSNSVSRYLERNYVYKISGQRSIKFFLRISPPQRPPNHHTQERLARQLQAALTDTPSVSAPCLMKVQGDKVSYLVTGRVKPADFEVVANELVPRLIDQGLFEVLGMRTTTHFSALSAPLDRREQLRSYAPNALRAAPPPTEAAIRHLLEQGEGETLECKASFVTDVSAKVDGRPPDRSETQCFRDVAKATVGLLNSFGGKILVGVAEGKHFDAGSLQKAGYAKPVRIGDYLVIGIDQEYDGDWDELNLKVPQKLNALVRDSPAGFYTLSRVIVGGRPIAVLDVAWAPKNFWLIDAVKGQGKTNTFFGRQGAETKPLYDRDLLDHINTHPRRS